MNDEQDIDIREKETVYDGFFRMDRYRLRHRKFDGTWTPEVSREIFERGNAVATLLYDPELDTVVDGGAVPPAGISRRPVGLVPGNPCRHRQAGRGTGRGRPARSAGGDRLRDHRRA